MNMSTDSPLKKVFIDLPDENVSSDSEKDSNNKFSYSGTHIKYRWRTLTRAAEFLGTSVNSRELEKFKWQAT